MPPRDSQVDRRVELAKIHLGAKQLGMDLADKNPDCDYRRMLWSVARVRSSSLLDKFGREMVIKHLARCGATFKKGREKRPRPPASKEALVAKIRAQLISAQRPDTYADGMAKHMFGVDRFEWCTEDQLHRIVAALNYDAMRREKQ
jgi:phage gp16-like protein